MKTTYIFDISLTVFMSQPRLKHHIEEVSVGLWTGVLQSNGGAVIKGRPIFVGHLIVGHEVALFGWNEVIIVK